MAMLFNIRALGVVCTMAFALPLAAQTKGETDEYVGSKGYVGEKGYVGDTAARPVQQHSANNKSNGSQPKRVYHGVRWTAPGCPAGFNGMYRGTLYCFNGRPIE